MEVHHNDNTDQRIRDVNTNVDTSDRASACNTSPLSDNEDSGRGEGTDLAVASNQSTKSIEVSRGGEGTEHNPSQTKNIEAGEPAYKDGEWPQVLVITSEDGKPGKGQAFHTWLWQKPSRG